MEISRRKLRPQKSKMNRRTIVPLEQISQHHYAGVSPIQPFSYASQPPTPPRKSIQHDTDAITQTRSFQMLQGWISDSEKITPSTDNPSGPTSTVDRQNGPSRRFSAGAPTSHPSRSFRYLQQQYATDNTDVSARDTAALRRRSDVPTTYRAVRQDTSEQMPVNRSETVNNRDDLTEIYNKLPPSFRAREPEAKRFTGATNPSRSFRFLQKMTEDNQQKDPNPVTGYIKPQQLIEKNNDMSSTPHTGNAPYPGESDF